MQTHESQVSRLIRIIKKLFAWSDPDRHKVLTREQQEYYDINRKGGF